MSDIKDKLPSIPTYFKLYVDPKVNLDETPSIPCPFHNEVSGKSFTYSRQLNVWRCWGACHCGGDVVDLHKLNYKFRSKEEAKRSLCNLCGISITNNLTFEKEEIKVNDEDVHRRRVYSAAVKLAENSENVNDWLELDYIVSKVPYDVKELEVFCAARGVLFNS